jgi:hypothetical protein
MDIDMEIIQAIALLCQLNGVEGLSYVERVQLTCQQYYVQCIDPVNASYKTLAKCIKERK